MVTVPHALYPFDSHTLTLDGGHRLHYLDQGPADGDASGPPVLMVHGNPTWSFYYRNLIRALSPSRRAIAPDHIGMGMSDKPPASRYKYTLSSRVDDLDALIDHLELDTFDLVVHDWGGMIGTAWAVRHPERVRRLVVLNTAAFHLPPSKRFPPSLNLARVPVLGETLVRGANAFCRGANAFCVTRAPLDTAVADAYLAPYDSWANRVAVHRFVADIPLAPGDDAWAIVSDTQRNLDALSDTPVWIGWGMRDFVFDRHFLDVWRERLPHAEVQTWDDAGHYILEDAPAEVIPAIARFLEAPSA